MRSFALLVAFFGVALTSLLAAQAVPDPSDATLSSVERLRALVERMKLEQAGFGTLQAKFEQSTASNLLLEPEESTGTFFYQAPDKVRWEYDSPTSKVIIINGEHLLTWYRDLGRAERVRVGRYSDAVFKYLGASGSLEALMEYFSLRVRFPETAKDPYRLSLEPRFARVEKRLRGMSVTIDGGLFVPLRLAYEEPSGDSTEYRFSDFQINGILSADHFELSVPPEVELRVIAGRGE